MRQTGTPPGLIVVVALLAVFGFMLVATVLWGPLHETYERACQLYPPLRGLGPLPFTLFLTAVLASATFGAGSLVAGIIRSARLAHSIQASRIDAPHQLRTVTTGLSIEEQVICIENPNPLAFCYGLFRPMVCVSRTMVEFLEPEELQAVITHEREHIRARDPLRLLFGKALTRALFMIPYRNVLYQRFVLNRELRADDECIATCDLEPLASALLKLGVAKLWNPDGAAGFNLVEERIRHLTEPDKAKSFGIPWTKTLGQAMILGGIALLGFSVLTVTAEAAVVGCLL